MKPCTYCNGRKVQLLRDDELRITVRCEKCGAEVRTPFLTEDSARSCWSTKMATLEKEAKEKEAAG